MENTPPVNPDLAEHANGTVNEQDENQEWDDGCGSLVGSIDATSEELDIGGSQSNFRAATRSSKRSKTSNKSANGVEYILSRARPKKTYEPDPFLSIDNLPKGKKIGQLANQKKSLTSISRGPKVPFNSPDPLSRASSRISRPTSRPSTSGLSGWNSNVPKHKKYLPSHTLGGAPAPNIKQPFKHMSKLEEDLQGVRPSSPGQQMMEQTAMATYHVARTLAKQQPQREVVISGRLLKAKLKPLSTSKLEGPTIYQCRGIVAGAVKGNLTTIDNADNGGRWQPFVQEQYMKDKNPGIERSRTFQRRQQVLAHHGHELLNRPGTGESMHTTSVASDLSEGRITELKDELDILEQKAQEAYMQAANRTEEPSTQPPPNSLVSLPDADHLSPIKSYHESEVFLTEEKDERQEIGQGDSQPSAPHSANPRKSTLSRQGSGVDSRPETRGSQRKVRFSADIDTLRAREAYKDSKNQQQQEVEGDDGEWEDVTDGNANNNNSGTGRSDVLKMSVSDIADGFAKQVNHRRVVYKPRPRSGRPPMADLTKPGDVTDMSVIGEHQKLEGEEDPDCKIMVTVTKKSKQRPISPSRIYVDSQAAAARAFCRAVSPRTKATMAAGPKEFMRAEKLRDIERAMHMRPNSAMVVYNDIEVQPNPKPIQERPVTPNRNVGLGGKHNASKRVTSAQANRRRPQSLRSNSSKRQGSAGPRNSASRSQSRCSHSHTHDPRIPVVVWCCVCTKKMKKYLSNEQAKFKDSIMCKDCQKFKGIMSQYMQVANVDNGAEQEEVLAIEYAPQDEEETERKEDLKEEIDEEELGIIDDVVDSDEEVQQFELLTDMDDIERSLAECRKEIQESQARYNKVEEKEDEREKRVRFADEKKEDEKVFITQNEAELEQLAESAVTEALGSARIEQLADDLVVGALSSALTQCTQLPPAQPAVKPLLRHIEVFTFDQGSSPAENGDDSASNGHITSYPASFMNDENADDKLQTNNQPFLEMLCEQMPVQPKETTKKTEKEEVLEVRAKPARMTKARRSNQQMPASVAPFSPLCFKINARAPAGFMYYFAYGFDMNHNRFGTYIQRANADRYWGLLFGFRLRFNKKALDEAAGCFPNIETSANSSVEGCLYLITPSELDLLDHHMGYPGQMEHVMLPVYLLNCEDASDLGVAQYCVPALMYIAKDVAIHQDPGSVDSSYAVDQCVKSGDLLSPAYKQHLQNMKQ